MRGRRRCGSWCPCRYCWKSSTSWICPTIRAGSGRWWCRSFAIAAHGECTLLSADPRIVTPFHIRLMQIVARADAAYGAPNLRLDGGTGLAAYYLHHRESEDLDFFSDPG